MDSRPGSSHKISEWLLEAVRFSVSIAVFLLGDRVYVAITGDQKPGGLPGEIASTLLIALMSGLIACLILQFVFGRPQLVVSWSLDSWDNPSRYPVIDFITSTDRGMKIIVAYRGGSILGWMIRLCARNSEVTCTVSLTPPNRVSYTGQVVFPEVTVTNQGVLYRLPGLPKVSTYGCEISLGRLYVSQVPIDLVCDAHVTSAKWWRRVIYRLIKIESNVDGFSLRSR